MPSLTYTFTRREKFLIALLFVLLVVVAWYKFIYIDTTAQINAIEAQITNVQANIEIDRTKVAQKNKMAQVIEQRKAAGAKAKPIPYYDNIKPLMAELNSIMAGANTYTLSFDELDTESTEYVLRGIGMQYSCNTYDEAEAIIASIADGEYPCIVDTITINNATASTVRSNGSEATATIHVVFFERPANGAAAATATTS